MAIGYYELQCSSLRVSGPESREGFMLSNYSNFLSCTLGPHESWNRLQKGTTPKLVPCRVEADHRAGRGAEHGGGVTTRRSSALPPRRCVRCMWACSCGRAGPCSVVYHYRGGNTGYAEGGVWLWWCLLPLSLRVEGDVEPAPGLLTSLSLRSN